MRGVLVTDYVHEILLEGLTAMGLNYTYLPKIGKAEVMEQIEDYEGLVINSKITVDKALLDKAKHLHFIGRLGSGLEIIDLPYAAACGVAVYSAPGGNCDAVAEHAMGMLLAFAIRLRQADARVRVKEWDREAHRGWELMGKTVGIIAAGHTGLAFARRLAGFGVKVLIHDKYKVDFVRDMGYAKEATLEEIQTEADIISFHLPLTEETIHYADAAFFECLKKRPLLINTSRGAVIDTEALVEALESDSIMGACLDVFEQEKPERFTEAESTLYTRLYASDRVLLTPHVAGWTVESKRRLASILLRQFSSHMATRAKKSK